MEAKFLTSALSFLSIFLAIYAQTTLASIVANESDETEEFPLSTAPVVYYGNPIVNIGEPIEITCVIPITEKVHWLRNGESLNRHNLRHSHNYSYSQSETAIEGEKHKIEAKLKVRHALKEHEGKYQCNSRYDSGYYKLTVRSDKQSATESGYQSIYELTPSSPDEIFTPTWQKQQQPHKLHKQHPAQHLSTFPPSSSADGYGNATAYGQGFAYNLPVPTSKYPYNDLTTLPWKTSSQGVGANGGGINRIYSATPPDFPPPRFSPQDHTVSPPEPPTIQLNNQTLPYYRQLDTATDTSSSATTILIPGQHHRQHHQQQQQQTQHTLNAFQLPLPPQPHQPHLSRTSHQPHQTHQPMSEYPVHHSEKYQTYSPRFVQPAIGAAGTVTPAPDLLTTAHNNNNNNNMGSMQQQPKTFLPILKEPISSIPNPSGGPKPVIFEIRTPLVLKCLEPNAKTTEPIIWKKKGVNVTEVPALNNRYRVIDVEGLFMIDKTDTIDDGSYSCEIKGVVKEFNVIARVVVRVPSNTGVVEGEKMKIICTSAGSSPKLSWSFGNYTNITNSTGRYVLSSDSESPVENSILSVENVTLDDKGEYKCHGSNEANEIDKNIMVATDFTTVRVKGKFAALWPFLGICAEVLILCLIILIYEKRRNKSELEESDTDPQEQKKKRRNYD